MRSTAPFALTIRLFANMIAGHVVILSSCWGWSSVLGTQLVAPIPGWLFALGIYLLEILPVIFIQAYVFTILSAVFISGMAGFARPLGSSEPMPEQIFGGNADNVQSGRSNRTWATWHWHTSSAAMGAGAARDHSAPAWGISRLSAGKSHGSIGRQPAASRRHPHT